MMDQSSFAASLLDPGVPRPGGLSTWNRSDPDTRFAVYRNNVVKSLIDALAETFPVCLELVGEEFFLAMARLFVLESPPRSCVLVTYGEDFPAFIAGFAPARTVPYLADVARLEMARVRAFHAADASPVTADTLAHAAREAEQLQYLVMACHPSVSVVRSPYAIVSLWAAHQGVGDIGRVRPDCPEDALVVRIGLEVQVALLPGGGAPFIQKLLAGTPLGEAANHACAETPGFDLSANISILTRFGAISTLQSPGRIRQ